MVGIPRDELFADVDSFAAEAGLTEITPLLRKGALVAQNPRGFEDMTDLDETEKDVFRVERDHRWKHSKTLYFTIILNSIAAAIQGWDQTGQFEGQYSRK